MIELEDVIRRFPKFRALAPTVDISSAASRFAASSTETPDVDGLPVFLYGSGEIDRATLLELPATAGLVLTAAAIVTDAPTSELGYEVLSTLGRGGMGVVQLARDRGLLRKVALKVVLDASRPEHVERFVAEARITAQLDQPARCDLRHPSRHACLYESGTGTRRYDRPTE
ncbi:MAG: serine/threonine protein kinase [Myxococcota bacterium]|jgi:serine/threonine protein kinase